MKQNTKMKVNSFYLIANEYRKTLTEEHLIETTNRTELFFKELQKMMDEKELIIIQINAKVRQGKSTVAIALGYKIFEMLKEKGFKDKNAKFSMSNIARDQHEYSMFMRDKNRNFDVVVTDEHNSMEDGGINATREKALLADYSNIQAARYIHRVNCSPADIADPNTDIVLEIKSTDKINKMTRMLLYYRMYKGGDTYLQLLGFIDVYVGDIIKRWDENIAKLFLKPTMTIEEQQILEKAKKEDFYVMYNVKKHEKLNMYQEEGVESPRKLEYAELTLQCVNKLKNLTKIKGLLKRETVKNYVKTQAGKLRIPMSILGTSESTDEVMGILEMYKAIEELKKKEEMSYKKYTKGEINTENRQQEKELHSEMLETLTGVIKSQMEELARYIKIKNKYNDVI